MKEITRKNWKITSYNGKRDTRRIYVKRRTPKGEVLIKGNIKNIYTTLYEKASATFIAPGYTNSTSVEIFDIERGDFDKMFGWFEDFLEKSFKEFLA